MAQQAQAKNQNAGATLQQQLEGSQSFSKLFNENGDLGSFLRQIMSMFLGDKWIQPDQRVDSIQTVSDEFQNMTANLSAVAENGPLTKNDVLAEVGRVADTLKGKGLQITDEHKQDLLENASQLYDKIGANAESWTPAMLDKFSTELGRATEEWSQSMRVEQPIPMSEKAMSDDIYYGANVRVGAEELDKLPLKQAETGVTKFEVHTMDKYGHMHVQGSLTQEELHERLGSGDLVASIVSVENTKVGLFLRDPENPHGDGLYIGMGDVDWENADEGLRQTLQNPGFEPIPTVQVRPDLTVGLNLPSPTPGLSGGP